MVTVPAVSAETLSLWLANARIAYHNLMIGRTVVEVMVDGYQTKFYRADANKLAAYIAQLEAQIASRQRRGAIGFYF